MRALYRYQFNPRIPYASRALGRPSANPEVVLFSRKSIVSRSTSRPLLTSSYYAVQTWVCSNAPLVIQHIKLRTNLMKMAYPFVVFTQRKNMMSRSSARVHLTDDD
ncbi:hypothetical protein M405DRAFT_930319 [Rhizopogon salebrosus TDB-379]|nr:hypothetical protein M405DRAFT_930319 [Rhizopogon salebrosus TDB-379]